jgi:thiol-disulfide isomerase/thioredoxin
MNWIIGGIIVLVVAAGGWFYVSMQEDGVMMEKEGEAVMEKKTGEETMMDKDEGVVMKDDAMQKEDTMMKDEGAMMEKDAMEGDSMMAKGSYQDYSADKLSLAQSGKVVLFFHAAWCPVCRSIESQIRADVSALGDVTILKVDFDTATALRQKYGVTTQYTFVQVDAAGNELGQWNASTLAQALARVE